MKKILIYIFLFLSPLSTQAFLGEDLGLDLYNQIDSGIEQYEDETYIYEVVGVDGSIKNEINRILVAKDYPECIGGDISIDEFIAIASGDTRALSKKISENCFDVDGNIPSTTLIGIQGVISEMSIEKSLEARKKTSNIYKNSRAGLYVNGNTNDSPFDLIADLQKIDEIVFNSEIGYEDAAIDDNSLFKSRQESRIAASNLSSNVSEGTLGGGDASANTGSAGGNNSGSDDEIETPIIHEGGVCEEPKNTSGLSLEALEEIFPNLEKTTRNKQILRKKEVNTSTSNSLASSGQNWECDDFFCINVEYITYDHKALGSKNNTLQYVIEKSNEHLKQHSNASFIQHEMPTNFYQLSSFIKDLPKRFTMNFEILQKPVPVINSKNSLKDNTGLGGKALLERYYKSKDLEYSRRNSIKETNQVDAERKSLINCAEQPATCVEKNYAEYIEYMTQNRQEEDFIQEALEQVGIYENSGNFLYSFAQLEGFVHYLTQYSNALKGYTKNLANKEVATH